MKNNENAFVLDSYYNGIINKSMEFLVKSDGSEIPPNMDKIVIYYSDPILRKKDTILKAFVEKGLSSDKSKRYRSVDEIIIAFRKI